MFQYIFQSVSTEGVSLNYCKTSLFYQNKTFTITFLYALESPVSSIRCQVDRLLNFVSIEACEVIQPQNTLLIIVLFVTIIFMIFAPVCVKSLEEHEGEGGGVKKMSQYRYQPTQFHLMRKMNVNLKEMIRRYFISPNRGYQQPLPQP